MFKSFIIILFTILSSIIYGQDGFTVDVSSGCSPLVVNFSYTEGGDPTNLSWNFGNSNTLSGDPTVDPIVLNPAISYILPGTYTITLTVTTSAGTTTYTSTDLITVFEEPIPNFSSSVTEGCGSFFISFSDLSELGDAPIIQWNWDFGDGGSSTVQNPIHNYNTPGVFDVSLNVTDQNGCNSTFIIQDYITSIDGVYP